MINDDDDTDATLYCLNMLDAVAPVKQEKISCDEQAWMKSRINTCTHRRNREFEKNCKSNKWKSLKRKCRKLCKDTKNDFAAKFVNNLRNKYIRSCMSSMKKLQLYQSSGSNCADRY